VPVAQQWVIVKRGAKSPTVRTVQYLLKAHGHDLDVDGIFGPLTEAAVKVFQGDNNLTADGIVGDKTWAKLIRQVKRGSKGDDVRAAQDHLRLRDLPETSGLAVDGIFGPLTETGTKAFQTWVTANQSDVLTLAADGIVGPKTWRALVLALGPVVD
jgi:peptidoglycan hydrolase-like protein with peptidoglycan-binding domain